MKKNERYSNIGKPILNTVYVERSINSHKYDYGSLLIIGGSNIYSGAPALSALAAYRTGVDLVTVVAPERAANIIASFSPHIITYPLNGKYLKKNHVKNLLDLASNSSAVVIGGGLGKEKETMEAVAKFLDKVEIPCVIDADAIHAVSKHKKSIDNKDFVITPHAHEFEVLTSLDSEGIPLNEKIELIEKVAANLRTKILLKGKLDIVSNGDENCVNETGCPEMTVGGTGDTLAGILGSLMAQGNDTFDSACAAAYINGRAGELAAKELGVSVTATDIIKKIPKVLK